MSRGVGLFLPAKKKPEPLRLVPIIYAVREVSVMTTSAKDTVP
jgi:hypothetical protein